MIKNSQEYERSQCEIVDEIYNTFVMILDKTDSDEMTGEQAATVVSAELANLDTKLRFLYYEQCKYDLANGTDRTLLKNININ